MDKKLFDNVVNELLTRHDKKGNNLNLVSLIASDSKDMWCYDFGEREAVDVRSIAKPILCLAYGAAIKEGLFFGTERVDLDTRIWKYIKKYGQVYEEEQLKKWENIRLIDLFRITFGHQKGIVFSKDVKEVGEDDLVNYILNFPITDEVGKHFVYSNAGGYLASSLISEYCGMSADKFVDKYVFSPLGIVNYSWRKYGKYCAGCTGLVMYNEDLHKIARLICNDGVYEGNQIIPKEWIKAMRTPQVTAPTHRYIADRAFPKWSYGLNLWICEDGTYYCDGSDGQYMIIIPDKGTVITVMGHQSDTLPLSETLGLFK